jgi:hypothetical protein
MPATPPPDLSLADVTAILRSSEGRTSVHRGDEGAGHGYGRHVTLTREQLWARVDETRNGAVALYTAFIAVGDQIAAARELLNSPAGKWARHEFRQGAPTARHPKGGQNGMFAKIHFVGTTRIVRYAGGGGTMPTNTFTMLLYRDDSRPHGLHIKTFFAAAPGGGASRVTIFTRDNSEFSHWP